MLAPGHLGVALLLAAPIAAILGTREGVAFSVLAASTAMLPDVDLVLPEVHHHGITHTFAFVIVASVALGLIATGVFLRYHRGFRSDLSGSVSPSRIFGFATTAFLLGSASHVFVDMFSAPDIAPPVEPFWPVVDSVVAFDVIPVNSDLWNFGFLFLGLLAQALVYLLAARAAESPQVGA